MSVAPAANVTPSAPLDPVARARAAHLSGAALRNASPAEQRAAVAAQFEAILVRQLLGKTMSSMVGGESSGAAGSIYGDLLTDTISQQLTAGQGLGLGRLLEAQLTPKGHVAATPAAASAAGSAAPATQHP
jgi:Rod binding domain-containing protein